MEILLSIIFFLLGFVLRDIFTYFYNINKKLRQADEILERERKRLEFKQKYDFSDCFEDEKEKNNDEE